MSNFLNRMIGKEKLAFGAAVFAGLMRILPHPANFTPGGGLAVYSGARISGWRAFVLPVGMMVLTGILLAWMQGYNFWTLSTLFVMLSFAVYVLLGRLVRNTENPAAIGGVILTGSVQFFLVSNLAVWAFSGMYALTWAGLSTCFLAAIPFFGMTVVGDLVYGGALFTAHHFLARNFFPQEAVASA